MANENKIAELFNSINSHIAQALKESEQLKKEMQKNCSDANPIFYYMRDLSSALKEAKRANLDSHYEWYDN